MDELKKHRDERGHESGESGCQAHGPDRQSPIEDGQGDCAFKSANGRVNQIACSRQGRRRTKQRTRSAARETIWPDAVTSSAEARRAPQPPAKSDPPHDAAESRPRPAVAPEEVIPSAGN